MWTRLRALRGRRWLIALCVAGAVVEAGVLRGVGFVELIPLAPQVPAPPPYGVFHDLRWLIVYHDSWLSLVWELALLVALRGLLTALLVRLAWPAALPRPSWPSLVGRGVGLALASCLLLSPGATTAFAGGVTSLSWFLPGVLLPLFVTVLVLPRGGFHRGWWRRPPSLRAIWISAVTFLVLSAGALVLTASPGWLVLPVAAAIGGYNAWAWTRLLA
ncbi:MAG TPA: hypothetical protein VE152_03075, partial [Acidimicrobiales bacterium]|nr:hypothetical protein [Acidimicrobiales bacterium]